jgi:hypothetical protein
MHGTLRTAPRNSGRGYSRSAGVHERVRAVTRTSVFVTLVAVLYLGLGVVILFLPESVSAHVAGIAVASLSAQLYGAAVMGLGATNWIARRSLLGGIYGRALVTGNFIHAGAATLVLLRPTIASGSPRLWIAFAVALLLAIGFGWLLFVSGGIPKAGRSE